jgi:hypothetical protein
MALELSASSRRILKDLEENISESLKESQKDITEAGEVSRVV